MFVGLNCLQLRLRRYAVNGDTLRLLAEPFPINDVEFRVSRAWDTDKGVECRVLAYITARAISQRLDDVVGPGNWQNTPAQVIELRHGIVGVQLGISILVNGVWVTKWDIAEQSQFEPAKGAYSGAMKRAGQQWGIGRYLYGLDETRVETSREGKGDDWNYARLPKDEGGRAFFWKTPKLPQWAIPLDLDNEASVFKEDIAELRKEWRIKFHPGEKNRSTLWDGFNAFVISTQGVGRINVDDPQCWTADTVKRVANRIRNEVVEEGISPDVVFTRPKK